MNQDVLLQRARLLISQNRTKDAADQLRQLLSQDPDVAEAHALLAMCMTQDQDQWHDATREAERAIYLAPDQSLSHYALAAVLEKRNRLPEALAAAREAIRLDGYVAHYFALAASIEAQQLNWKSAHEIASQGLEVDPDDEGCTTIRALSLERLGRTGDAMSEADAAVAKNPDSAEAHAMRGWAQMQSGQYRAAQESFRESLRLDPTYEFARTGMIQALNNNHLLFRLVFRFYSFIGRMAQAAQWAIIIGLFVGMRILRGLADQYPALQPYVTPISMLYLGFCLLSWIADPLFNTFLRFHPFGRFLLSNKQKWASNLVALCIAIGIAGGVLQAVRGDLPGAIIMLLAPLFLTLPVSTVFAVDEGWPMVVAILAATGLTVVCALTMILVVMDGPWGLGYLLFIMGILVFSFLGNWLRTVTVRN